MKVSRYKQGRFWAVYDPGGGLVCVCVYKRGAREVVRRLTGSEATASVPAPAAPAGTEEGR